MVKWQDFDFDGKVKIPWGFYLVLLYLLRGYITWVLSLTYRDDPSLLLSLIYTESKFFYLALVVGIPAVFVQFIFALKSQKEKPLYQKLWLSSYWLLALSMVIDIVLQVKQILVNNGLVHWIHMALLIGGVYLLWYWLKSAKVKRFFSNWLLALEPKKQDKTKPNTNQP